MVDQGSQVILRAGDLNAGGEVALRNAFGRGDDLGERIDDAAHEEDTQKEGDCGAHKTDPQDGTQHVHGQPDRVGDLAVIGDEGAHFFTLHEEGHFVDLGRHFQRFNGLTRRHRAAVITDDRALLVKQDGALPFLGYEPGFTIRFGKEKVGHTSPVAVTKVVGFEDGSAGGAVKGVHARLGTQFEEGGTQQDHD